MTAAKIKRCMICNICKSVTQGLTDSNMKGKELVFVEKKLAYDR